MAQTIRDVMTSNPKCLESSTTVVEAARCMKEQDIGDVLVMEGGELRGIVTDRDIVVRSLAEGRDATSTTLGDICSGDVVTAAPDTTITDAARLMSDRAIRRLPVVEGGAPVGVVSIGDLAIERDPKSALADISAASGNT